MRTIIQLSSLRLSEENPRLNVFDVNQDLLETMLNDQGTNLLELSKDILQYGLSPLDLWAVYPSESGPEYVVAEGNRRLSALMILNNPELILNSRTGLYPQFKRAIEQSGKQPLSEVECVVFPEFNDPMLQHWIQLRHLGLNEGKGTATWDSKQKARYVNKQIGTVAILEFWKEVVEKGILTQLQVDSVSKTNWERILNKKGCDYLGLTKVQNQYILPLQDLQMFSLKLRKIADDLANRSVAFVYDNDRIQEFLNRVNFELFGPQIEIENLDPHHQDELDLDTFDSTPEQPLQDDQSRAIDLDPVPATIPTVPTNQVVPIRDVFNGCRTIIPYGYRIASSNTRISRIIFELKNLDPNAYPNSCGLLLRILFELSAKHYLEKQDHQDHTSDEFVNAISQASRRLRENNMITDGQHSALTADKDNLRKLFNGYAHETEVYPSSESLKSYFKTHKEFILKCLG